MAALETTQDLQEPRGSWMSARMYDPCMRFAERAGMAERRRRLIAGSRGDTLEIGAGTGLNLSHYPATVGRLVITEPERHMAQQLRRKIEGLERPVELVEAQAEALPFDDDSFETVVCTFALCTIADPDRAIAEVHRVLRPGGQLLFLEHVRSDSERLGRWQDRLNGVWSSMAEGCHCNRRTVELLRDQGFTVALTDEGAWKRMPPIVRPVVGGAAIAGGSR